MSDSTPVDTAPADTTIAAHTTACASAAAAAASPAATMTPTATTPADIIQRIIRIITVDLRKTQLILTDNFSDENIADFAAQFNQMVARSPLEKTLADMVRFMSKRSRSDNHLRSIDISDQLGLNLDVYFDVMSVLAYLKINDKLFGRWDAASGEYKFIASNKRDSLPKQTDTNVRRQPTDVETEYDRLYDLTNAAKTSVRQFFSKPEGAHEYALDESLITAESLKGLEQTVNRQLLGGDGTVAGADATTMTTIANIKIVLEFLAACHQMATTGHTDGHNAVIGFIYNFQLIGFAVYYTATPLLRYLGLESKVKAIKTPIRADNNTFSYTVLPMSAQNARPPRNNNANRSNNYNRRNNVRHGGFNPNVSYAAMTKILEAGDAPAAAAAAAAAPSTQNRGPRNNGGRPHYDRNRRDTTSTDAKPFLKVRPGRTSAPIPVVAPADAPAAAPDVVQGGRWADLAVEE